MKKTIRTCVSCGVKKEKSELIRFVLDETVQMDVKQCREGRGAYLCGDEKCMDIGLNKKKLIRFLLAKQLRRNRKIG